MTSIAIEPRTNLNSTVTIPGSKSCTARALVMAGLTKGQTVLIEPADCEDSDYMVEGLHGLGLTVVKQTGQITVNGAPFTQPTHPIFIGNSGTAMRFLTAACATLHGTVTIDGIERMRQRPIADLLKSLERWGIVASGRGGCPPVQITSTGQFGGKTSVKGDASSQYLTGLLLVAPRANSDVEIDIEGELVSKPYIDLTIAMMRERGVSATHRGHQQFHVRANQEYKPGTYAIEADASGASYFLAAAAIAGGRVRVKNLSFASEQGDAQFARVLEKMGCKVVAGDDFIEVQGGGALQGIDIDLNAMPDMAQTLAIVAMFANGRTRIRNVHNLRIKETDRIKAVVTELRKLGTHAEERDDGMVIVPGTPIPAAIDTYDDHRMAMCFAMAGLRIPGVVINHPECVRKTFPDFFTRFASLR